MAESGILPRVQGPYVAQGSSLLPDPATAPDRPHEMVVEAGALGLVRLFYVRRLAQHRRHRHWFWAAISAEFASGQAASEDTPAVAPAPPGGPHWPLRGTPSDKNRRYKV